MFSSARKMNGFYHILCLILKAFWINSESSCNNGNVWLNAMFSSQVFGQQYLVQILFCNGNLIAASVVIINLQPLMRVPRSFCGRKTFHTLPVCSFLCNHFSSPKILPGPIIVVSSVLLAETTWRWVPFGDDFSDKQLDYICCLQRRQCGSLISLSISPFCMPWDLEVTCQLFFLCSALPIYAYIRFILLDYWTTLLAYVSPVSFTTTPWFWMFLKYYQNRNSKKQEFMHIILG